jgi:hypothetical protein
MTALEEAFARVRALPTRDHTPEHIAAVSASGRITDAARWDCASPEQRAVLNPNFNPNKRWYEQKENRAVRRT